MKLYLNATFRRKESNHEAKPCVVEKFIELPANDFACYMENLLESQPFIAEHAELMNVDRDGLYHCLLVLGKDHDDGILIESEGADYARYSAFVPNARQIVFMEQRYNCIQDLENGLMGAADDVVSQALAYDGEEDFRITLDALSDKHGFDVKYSSLLAEMLREHTSVNDVIVFSDEMMISVNRQNEKKKQHYRPTDDEIEIMKAKHILWNHDVPGGEQADFSNMDLTDCYLGGASLEGAIFCGTILRNADMACGSFTFCDFTNADMVGVTGVEAVFEEANFTGAKLISGHYRDSFFTHCNFTGASIQHSDFKSAIMDNSTFTDANLNDSDFWNTSMNNSDFTNATLGVAEFTNAQMNNCIGLTTEPDEAESQGMTMQ